MNSRITLVIILNLLLHQDQAIANLRVIFDRIEALEVPKESKLQVVSLDIVPYNNSYFQEEFIVSQDMVSSKLKLSIEVTRCLVREAPDTCEYLIHLKPPNTCMLINAENAAWSTVTDGFTPKLRCPVKKGKYVANNLTFDASKWTIFPLDKWFFKITVKAYEGDVLSLSAIVEENIITPRDIVYDVLRERLRILFDEDEAHVSKIDA